ncbi:DUF4263 domain-containing protein [Paraburkholderia sp. A1RI_3L]|uniref:Shedu immune nuclease family protein n=1 Tax=Paraburkholderia TaxID=1822464 RepID=UPI0018F2C574|nr:Shedu immune nuclease family protein [Paraburkholderia kururiensis]
MAQRWNIEFVPPQDTILLAIGNVEEETITTFPLNTNAASSYFLKPKYDRLRAIQFVGFRSTFEWPGYGNEYSDDDSFDNADDSDGEEDSMDEVTSADVDLSWPRDVDDVKEFFRDLPSGFVRDPCFGLGLNYDLRFITDTVERIKGMDTLSIFKGRGDSPTLNGSTYSISARSLDEVRKAINRTHEAALNFANSEKSAYANNSLLHALDGSKYPLMNPAYRKDSIVRALGSAPREGVQLSAADQQVVVATMKSHARQLSRSKTQEMMELSNEIELVTLEVLVQRLKDMLDKRKNEHDWQRFFNDNPFILRLAFGFPVLKMGDQFSVGGRKFDGTGDKIADFAVKAVATGNLGLIEIKTPHTELLSKKVAYRRDVFAPSWDLSGAVSQVLDQANHLNRNLASLKENSEDYSVEAFAINAVVIAGRSPAERAERKSFEFYRNSLRSVVILTFDELVQKLEQLLQALRPTSETHATH